MNDERNIMTLRLPPDQMRRLDRAARRRRQSKQSFVQELTMAAVSELEETAFKKQPPISAQENPPTENSGLGIAAALAKPKEPIESTAALATAPVVVQVGNAGPITGPTASAGDLDRLANYVVKGDDFMRDMRKRTIVDVLRASAATDEEFNVLVARLEEAVSIKTQTVENNSGVNRLARIAFDKLTTLLRGD
jgi:uncharacterized protein (DUF1778 family)